MDASPLRIVGAGLVATIAVLLGAVTAGLALHALLTGEDFVNPHPSLLVLFFGGAALTLGGAVAMLLTVWPRADAGRHRERVLWAGVYALNVGWFTWLMGAIGLGSN